MRPAALALFLLFASGRALLPAPAGRFAPSLADVSDGGVVFGADLSDVETCGSCHADVVAQWRLSAHAFASFNNPIYRMTVDRLRTQVGRDASRFCAGCHDVALLFDGAMSNEVLPEERRAHAGVTCRTCHGIEQTSPDGNGSYRLATSDIPLPSEKDPGSLQRHLARVALRPLRTADLCGSCHRAFLDEGTGNASFLVGMDDYTAWSQSIFAGSRGQRIDAEAPAKDCRGCHMPRVPAVLGDVAAKRGSIASHQFLGGHTWLASMEGQPALVEQVQHFLQGAVTVDFGAAVFADGSRWLPADEAPLRAGQGVTLDVVVRNQGVGHRFPGGTLDAQDAWLEVEVRDARGVLLASTEEASAHRFRSLAVDLHGRPLLERQTHQFRAVAFNQTLGPREATVVQYVLPARALAGATLPVQATARIRHRSRNLDLQRASCDESRTPRGRRFARASTAFVGRELDPCAPQPVTEIARSDVWLGAGAAGHAVAGARLKWERLYEHGLGMARGVQERLDEARPSLDAALKDAEGDGSTSHQATVLCTLAQVAAREGRTDEALDFVRRARRLAPGHPALFRAEGEAFAQVWRWREALAPLRQAALLAPADVDSWRELALAEGSAGEDELSLEAAHLGLLLQPRDADLLRLQAQATEALSGDGKDSETALKAYLTHRPADEGPALRALCSSQVEGCALERVPVHAHVLKVDF